MGVVFTCEKYRPRYKVYVRNSFDGEVHALAKYGQGFPKLLPKIGAYLLKKLRQRVQNQPKHNTRHATQEIANGMEALNQLTVSCKTHLVSFESYVLQAIMLLFDEHDSTLVILALQTLRTYLPFSHQVTVNDIVRLTKAVLASINSNNHHVKHEGLKALLALLQQMKKYRADTYTKLTEQFRPVVSCVIENTSILNSPSDENELTKCAMKCYHQLCSLVSDTTLSILLKPLAQELTYHYRWQPEDYCFRLVDDMFKVGHRIQATNIVEQLLVHVSLMDTGSDDGQFDTVSQKLDTQVALIQIVQRFSKRVPAHRNRSPILSKLCRMFEFVDASPLITDSIPTETDKLLRLATGILTAIQYYVIDMSYIDSQPALQRMLRQLDPSDSLFHTSLLLKACLILLAHRCEWVRISQPLQAQILQIVLRFQIQQAQSQSEVIVKQIHLFMQNMLVLTSNKYLPKMGFNETLWAENRIDEFFSYVTHGMASVVDMTGLSMRLGKASPNGAIVASPVNFPLDDEGQMSEMDILPADLSEHNILEGLEENEEEIEENLAEIEIHQDMEQEVYFNRTTTSVSPQKFMISYVEDETRCWVYSSIYVYLESAKCLTPSTVKAMSQTIIITCLSQNNDQLASNPDNHFDFPCLIPFLTQIQKLGKELESHHDHPDATIHGKTLCRRTPHSPSHGRVGHDGTADCIAPSQSVENSVSGRSALASDAPASKELLLTPRISGDLKTPCISAIMCHTLVLSVLLSLCCKIRSEMDELASRSRNKQSQIKNLLAQFIALVASVHQRRKEFGEIWSGLVLDSTGALTADDTVTTALANVKHLVPFKEATKIIKQYLRAANESRMSDAAWINAVSSSFPVSKHIETLMQKKPKQDQVSLPPTEDTFPTFPQNVSTYDMGSEGTLTLDLLSEDKQAAAKKYSVPLDAANAFAETTGRYSSQCITRESKIQTFLNKTESPIRRDGREKESEWEKEKEIERRDSRKRPEVERTQSYIMDIDVVQPAITQRRIRIKRSKPNLLNMTYHASVLDDLLPKTILYDSSNQILHADRNYRLGLSELSVETPLRTSAEHELEYFDNLFLRYMNIEPFMEFVPSSESSTPETRHRDPMQFITNLKGEVWNKARRIVHRTQHMHIGDRLTRSRLRMPKTNLRDASASIANQAGKLKSGLRTVKHKFGEKFKSTKDRDGTDEIAKDELDIEMAHFSEAESLSHDAHFLDTEKALAEYAMGRTPEEWVSKTHEIDSEVNTSDIVVSMTPADMHVQIQKAYTMPTTLTLEDSRNNI